MVLIKGKSIVHHIKSVQLARQKYCGVLAMSPNIAGVV
jgi:hypothetical protein